MNYNELLNKISSQMLSAAGKTSGSRTTSGAGLTSKEDNTSIMLNRIGLEVQRQGGY